MPESYRTLTRKYRPRTFDDIVSQNHVSDTLKNAIKQNRLAHAYMFCGPRGVGKTTMARVLARKVNNVDEEVSGESLQQTLNIIELDAASNRSVNDIERLRETVRVPPQNGRYKIYIIDEVHMLSKTAFNALLKTLEEPPEHVIFIFATTEPHKVLPTILSRVQRFDFKRITIDEMVDRLAEVAEKENINIDEESLHVIAKKADGALRDALGLLDQAIAFCGDEINHDELIRALNVVSIDRLFQFMETVEDRDTTGGLQLIDELLQEGYDIQEFLVGLTEHLRNLYVARSSKSMHLVEASDRAKKRLRTIAEHFSEDDLMRMLHIVSEAQFKVKEAHQPKIQFEITLLKLIHMGRSKKLDELIGNLKEVKKKGGLKKTANKPHTAREEAHSSDSTGQINKKSPREPAEQTPKNAESPLQPTGDSADEITRREPAFEAQVRVLSPENGSGDEDIFGSPSLGNGKTDTVLKKKTVPEEQTKSAKRRTIGFQQVKETWDDYVMTLKEQMPQMIYFQMQRVEPVKLKNRELVLRCNDDFAKKMVEEHKRELAKILEGKVGGFLQFACVVQKDKSGVQSSMSPYDRFKKLQERDPQIKTLVELFGAELDYNLNQ